MYERLFKLQEETLKVLANQKRLEIVQLLQNKALTVSEMVDMLGVPQANISQHLSLLRQVRIVTTRKDGLRVYYHLSDKRILAVVRELRGFLKNQFAHEPEITHISSLDNNVYPIVRDPVCGMRISASEAYSRVEHDGHVYYFCASGCKLHFEQHPNQYVRKEALTR
ncbi:MAG TPA: metalloregulator ArsR/SmtB family transcription factor [Candidatus Saccharimonadales bacterium]|nr:metalloregulator ArsR/SmtB family transcription factor [Candidatus Saccharimonadales bacterium]